MGTEIFCHLPLYALLTEIWQEVSAPFDTPAPVHPAKEVPNSGGGITVIVLPDVVPSPMSYRRTTRS